MRDHAFQLRRIQQPNNPFGDGHRGVLRVAPRGERIGRLSRDHIDLGYGELGPLARPPNHGVNLGSLGLGDRLRVVGVKDDPVRIPISPHVHEDRKTERQDQTPRAAQPVSNQENQGRQRG